MLAFIAEEPPFSLSLVPVLPPAAAWPPAAAAYFFSPIFDRQRVRRREAPVGIALLLQRFDLLPRGFAISDNMSYGLAFLIGLVASVSTCIAVTGGLLVAVAARYNEAYAHLTDMQRVTPHLYFNAGRIVSYALLGGAVGALGSALTLSPRANGILTIAASVVMIVLGLQMLRLGPSLLRLLPSMPKAFAHRIHDFAERKTKGAAFLLGASTSSCPAASHRRCSSTCWPRAASRRVR